MELKKLRPLLQLYLFLPGGALHAQALADSTCNRSGCCCGSDDPTPAGVMISHAHAKNEWMLSYRYMGMGMQGIIEGTATRRQGDVLNLYSASPRLMQMHMHMLMAMYGITDKLTLMAMLHYNVNYMEMMMPMGSRYYRHGMSSSGLGDTRLHALYAVSKKENSQLLLSLGINLPTGSIQSKGKAGSMMYPDLRLPYGMQSGSGSYDLLPCLNYLSQRKKMTYSAQLSSMLHSNYNAVGYKLGNELSLNAWAAWQWLSFINSSLRLEAATKGKISGKDQTLHTFDEPSADPENYGGKQVSVYIGASFRTKKGFLAKNRLSIEYGLPAYQNLNGIQMRTKSCLYAAWSITF